MCCLEKLILCVIMGARYKIFPKDSRVLACSIFLDGVFAFHLESGRFISATDFSSKLSAVHFLSGTKYVLGEENCDRVLISVLARTHLNKTSDGVYVPCLHRGRRHRNLLPQYFRL